MSRLSAKVPLTPPRRKRKAQIKVLRTLSGHQKQVETQPLFKHSLNQGQAEYSPHSLGDQISQGRDSAIVRGWGSFKAVINHSHDHAFTHLSPTFTLLNYNQLPE